MKKVISFDLDGTLVNAGYGDAVWNLGIPDEFSKKHGIPFEQAKGLIRNQYESVGDIDLLWYDIDYWLDKFQLPVSAGDLLKRYESRIEPIPFAEEVLDYFDGKYTLVIASNAARIFVEKELGYTGFHRFFAHTISATSDYKMVKKEGAFYKKLCESLQVLPEEMVHVGDHPVFDHDAPSIAGIESYYLMREEPVHAFGPSDLNGRRIIRSLKELFEKL